MLFGPKFASLIFSDESIKVAAAKPTPKGFKIFYLAKKTLPEGAVFNGQVVNGSLFKEALKTFFLENYERLKTRNLVLGLNEQEVFLAGVSFPEKPRKLPEAIAERLAPVLPFELEGAKINYREAYHGTYQVAAAKIKTLQLLSSVFGEVGFSLNAIVPIPLIFPKLIGETPKPYLFISSQSEGLIYVLVEKNVATFSSTVRLKKQVVESEGEIIKVAEEIINEEYGKNNKEPLKNVFVSGKEDNFLKGFFSARDFNTEVVSFPTLPSKKMSFDSTDFIRCIALSRYDDSVLAFPKLEESEITRVSAAPVKKGSSLKYFVLFLLVLALAAAVFFFWPTLNDMFLDITGRQKSTEPTKIATTASTQKAKQSTPEAAKKEAASSAQPQEGINKADFKIRILNGTGKAGTAKDAQDFLSAKGYNVVSTGNADKFGYEKTVVQAREGREDIVSLLTKDLKERYTIDTGLPLPEGSPFDIIIIIGGE